MQISGVISAITPKPIVAKTGKNYTVYSATINGTEVGLGFNKLKLTAGMNVTLNVVSDKYGVKIDEANPTGPPLPPTTNTAPANVMPGKIVTMPSTGGKPFPVPHNHGDISIIRQSALKAAVDLYTSLKPSTGADHVEIVIEMAYKFAEYSSGQREVRLAKEIVANGKADNYITQVENDINS